MLEIVINLKEGGINHTQLRLKKFAFGSWKLIWKIVVYGDLQTHI